MANDSDAEVLEVIDRQLRQHRAVDLIVPERRLILPKAKAPQPNPDVHRRFLRPARMMILRSHGVYGFGPLRRLWGESRPLRRCPVMAAVWAKRTAGVHVKRSCRLRRRKGKVAIHSNSRD